MTLELANRPDRDTTLMEVAKVFAQRSTCPRLHVGAVFSRDGRILVTGYNGAPKGLPHCTHWEYHPHDPITKEEVEKLRQLLRENEGMGLDEETIVERHIYVDNNRITINTDGKAPGCITAEHAERNAIAWAARNGVKLEGCEVHVTHMPCLPCAMSLINAGVEKVTFETPYRILDGVELLDRARIQVRQWVSGQAISMIW